MIDALGEWCKFIAYSATDPDLDKALSFVIIADPDLHMKRKGIKAGILCNLAGIDSEVLQSYWAEPKLGDYGGRQLRRLR